ncbi:hypothetical protein GCM10023314_32630 [Algibacter agarivorans]|uniref:Uncharacterized protein n=1 Tax=Algibacter agarivorans TaxID=1109741 RepID=A0ABP9GXS7_9FLAO
MASTATGLLGIPIAIETAPQLKGAFTVPHPTKRTSIRTATSLFSIRNFMLLFSISMIIKQLDISVGTTPNTVHYPYDKAIG